jgi:hypothetical protein
MKNSGVAFVRPVESSAKQESMSLRKIEIISARCSDAGRNATFGTEKGL